MPRAKVAGKARKVKTTKGNLKSTSTSRKPTFTCACTGGCKGRIRELSEALYKKHAKFRELDEATDKGNMDDLAPESPRQANLNVQYSQHDESVTVSFKFKPEATSLNVLCSVLRL
jgi:hypothetical protein